MQEILEILKYTIPSIIVFVTSYYILNTVIKNDQWKRKMELNFENRKLLTPLKLQAYERITLFLERISPEAILPRIQSTTMNSKQLHYELLMTIRNEYDYNLSQQIYVSGETWQVVKLAKENMVKFINSVADSVPGEVPAIELSRRIFEVVIKVESSPTSAAIEYVRNEVRQLF